MYIDNYEFKDWMQKLLDKLEEVGKDVKSLQTNPEVMPGDKLLDYRASDVREFIKKRFDVGTLRKFEKEHGTDK